MEIELIPRGFIWAHGVLDEAELIAQGRWELGVVMRFLNTRKALDRAEARYRTLEKAHADARDPGRWAAIVAETGLSIQEIKEGLKRRRGAVDEAGKFYAQKRGELAARLARWHVDRLTRPDAKTSIDDLRARWLAAAVAVEAMDRVPHEFGATWDGGAAVSYQRNAVRELLTGLAPALGVSWPEDDAPGSSIRLFEAAVDAALEDLSRVPARAETVYSIRRRNPALAELLGWEQPDEDDDSCEPNDSA